MARDKTSNPFFKVADTINEEPGIIKPEIDYNPKKEIEHEHDDIKTSFRKQINQEVLSEEEAGKNISVYLSAEVLKIIKSYMKSNKIQNRSKLIEAIILSVLKE